MDACYSLEKQQEYPRHIFERNFTSLDYSYDDILQTLLDTKIIMLPKSSSYGNPFLDIYCAYHRHNEHSTCWSSLGRRTYQVDLNLIPRTKTRDKPKDELNPMISKAYSKFSAN